MIIEQTYMCQSCGGMSKKSWDSEKLQNKRIGNSNDFPMFMPCNHCGQSAYPLPFAKEAWLD